MITDPYFDRFETKKYKSNNPIQRTLIKRFVRSIHDLFIQAQPATRIVEVGCGEGFLSGYLSEKFPEKSFTGVDLSEDDIARLKKKFPAVEAHVGSIYDLSFLSPPYDLVMCCEVLEHLEEPEKALDQLAQLTNHRLILSVPHEPLFMLSNLARGKNVTRFGNDIEHINHWGPRSFRRLLASRFEVLALQTSYPWVMALVAPRSA